MLAADGGLPAVALTSHAPLTREGDGPAPAAARPLGGGWLFFRPVAGVRAGRSLKGVWWQTVATYRMMQRGSSQPAGVVVVVVGWWWPIRF